MIPASGGAVELQAILILKSFALHALPSRAMGLPKAFCDLVGMLSGGRMIGVKLMRPVPDTLTTDEVRRDYGPEIARMQFCCPEKHCRLEIWIALAEGQWQFFEIAANEVREVEHAGQP